MKKGIKGLALLPVHDISKSFFVFFSHSRILITEEYTQFLGSVHCSSYNHALNRDGAHVHL